MGNREYNEKLVFIALLVALSVVLGIIDRFISNAAPNPGIRIGLANIVILTGLYYLNFKESLLLIVLKSVLTGLILGNNTIMFLVGFSGTILSFIVMYSLLKFDKEKVSLVGISVSGSIAHNIGQVMALIIFYGINVVFHLFWLIPLGVGTGFFVGYVVSVLRTYLNTGQVFKSITNKKDKKEILEKLFNDDNK